jgi:hypothetical protein
MALKREERVLASGYVYIQSSTKKQPGPSTIAEYPFTTSARILRRTALTCVFIALSHRAPCVRTRGRKSVIVW